MVSDNKHIEKLLEKYFEGQTNLEEEALLKNYFTSDKIASHLEQYRSLFQYFSVQKTQSNAPVPRLETQSLKRYWLSGIAAGLVLFLGLYGWQDYKDRQLIAQQAYEDSQNALALIGKYLNQGQDAIYELNYLEKSSEIVFRSNKNK